MTVRWDECITTRGDDEIRELLTHHFKLGSRRALLIASCGFDPRATAAAEVIATCLPAGVGRAVLFREVRNTRNASLASRGEATESRIRQLFPCSTTREIQVFGGDRAVVVGHSVARAVKELDLSDVTDVLVDFTALSVGVCFPLIRYLLEVARVRKILNVHTFITPYTMADERVVPIPTDTARTIHGFAGGWSLDVTRDRAKLWMPQLRGDRRAALQRIYAFVEPHDVVPVLPFPARNPRTGDEVVAFYRRELEETWEADARSFVYAAEDDPVDLYRTILQIADARERVFSSTGGSTLVLSPTGSKAHALGTLMAAYERDLPVVYVETAGYSVLGGTGPTREVDTSRMRHLWLAGEVYV